MKESNYKTYDELPLFLNAETVAECAGNRHVLGIRADEGKGLSRVACRESSDCSERKVHRVGRNENGGE